MATLTFEQFSDLCEQALTNKFKCPRHALTHKNCVSESRRKNCYGKYTRKNEKIKVRLKDKRKSESELYNDLVKKVWGRDTGFEPDTKIKNWNVRQDWYKYCRFYNCLNEIEKFEYQNEFTKVPDIFIKALVMAHRVSKGSHKELKYDHTNVFLISRFAHDRIDKGFDPITGKPIDKEHRDLWWERIADY